MEEPPIRQSPKPEEAMRSEGAGSPNDDPSQGAETQREPCPSSTSRGKRDRLDATTPPRPSFGVELEFMIAECDGPDPDADIAHQLPPRLPKVDMAMDDLHELFVTKGLPVGPAGYSDSAIPSEEFAITQDSSVREGDWEAAESGYVWSSIEVSTPAQFSTDAAFDLIRMVVSLITTNFRCRVNETCGFHVHFGNGFDKVEGRHARKLAALLWAAEPVLSMLHPPERAFNDHSRSMRRTKGASRLAQGDTAENARRHLARIKKGDTGREYGRQRDYGDSPEPIVVRDIMQGGARPVVHPDQPDKVAWRADGYEPFRRPEMGQHHQLRDPKFPNEGRKTIKRGPPVTSEAPQKAQAYPFSRVSELSDNRRPANIAHVDISDRFGEDQWVYEPADNVSAWHGIHQLLSCDVGAHQVARLLTLPRSSRANWNFKYRGYDDRRMEDPAWLPDEWLSSAGRQQRELDRKAARACIMGVEGGAEWPDRCAFVTVEAREAAGTLDAEWIVNWVKICCGIFEFARDAGTAHYMSVIDKCALASDHGEAYDVVDLLRNIGLFSEANHCDERLRRREEAWFDCILFKPRTPEQRELELGPEVVERYEKIKWL